MARASSPLASHIPWTRSYARRWSALSVDGSSEGPSAASAAVVSAGTASSGPDTSDILCSPLIVRRYFGRGLRGRRGRDGDDVVACASAAVGLTGAVFALPPLPLVLAGLSSGSATGTTGLSLFGL